MPSRILPLKRCASCFASLLVVPCVTALTPAQVSLSVSPAITNLQQLTFLRLSSAYIFDTDSECKRSSILLPPLSTLTQLRELMLDCHSVKFDFSSMPKYARFEMNRP